ncbi:hypothetical protein PISMIDRAFT_673762 [Pisolithus microcarpus 441]|uniref:Uncharacterized protein n=1 Tax=Pisolithus microcarpus 441 TaxID=765257 RepID=A0A0C9ZRH7_9AGAM|nr:hypothetical protein PISMIDRAFT_673762 [Pisolithus microcarpus 441]
MPSNNGHSNFPENSTSSSLFDQKKQWLTQIDRVFEGDMLMYPNTHSIFSIAVPRVSKRRGSGHDLTYMVTHGERQD